MMANSLYGNFGPLLGVAYVSSTQCRFLVYTACHAEVLAHHELKLRQIIHQTGWLEYDATEIWSNILDCIDVTYQSLIMMQINPKDIIAVGICTQRGTTVLWDKKTGKALYNAIGWSDCRTVEMLKAVLKNVKCNVNHTRSLSGLPLSTCFSALKIKWLLENVPSAALALQGETCLFGTLDSWLLWNFTGAGANGVHLTDVTNAGYTGLMNIRTLQWDRKLCELFRVPMSILPGIRSNSEIYGFVIGGLLGGLPIAGCIGEQPAILLGHFATRLGDNACAIDDCCHLFLNTGKQLIESTNGLISGVAYKLGPNAKPYYALEGAICNAGSSINWLKKTLNVNAVVDSSDNIADTLISVLGEKSMESSRCLSSFVNLECGIAAKRCEITFVPAFHGLYSPYWRYDTRGVMIGLTSTTSAENVTKAVYEATGFQIHEILQAFKRDTSIWNMSKSKDRLIIGGDFVANNTFVQFITDILGILLQRPHTVSPPGLGAMIATGITMNVVTLSQSELMYTPPSDVFTPTTTKNRRALLYERWNYAIKKCLSWNNYNTYEADVELFARREQDPYYYVRRSVPGTLFLMSTFLLLVLTTYFERKN